MLAYPHTYIKHRLQYLYFACLFAVCLYPINVKTAESIGPKLCVGPHMTPRKGYGLSKFQKIASNKM